jgi:hypothetical protein
VIVERLGIDSVVLGGNVLSIQDFDPAADFAAFESGYVGKYGPVYVSCRLPMESLTGIHALEAAGFRLIETQIRSSMKLRKQFDVSGFPYHFESVSSETELAPVLDIAASTFTHDRFFVDPYLGPAASGARYRGYVTKSFQSLDEAVYRLVDSASGITVAFKTHRYLANGEVLLLLGGVHPNYKTLGLGLLNEYFELNELLGRGIRRVTTHISAANYPVFNLEIRGLGFRVDGTFAVFRKLYGSLLCPASHAEAY